MSSDLYFVIGTSEDGDVWMMPYHADDLKQALEDKDWGDLPIQRMELEAGYVCNFRTDLQEKAGVYIIKGRCIVPKPVSVVKEWDVSGVDEE
jgi:hypothetical protein